MSMIWIEERLRISADTVVRAFERNCPNVRMTRDEREELWRLISVALRATRGEL